MARATAGRARARGRSRTAMGALKRRETGSARAVMPGAQVRAPSIERLGLSGALCSATGSTAVYVACLGCGSATKTPVHSRIDASRWWLKTVHARGLWQPATVCWAEKLPAVHDDSGRALGSMLRCLEHLLVALLPILSLYRTAGESALLCEASWRVCRWIRACFGKEVHVWCVVGLVWLRQLPALRGWSSARRRPAEGIEKELGKEGGK